VKCLDELIAVCGPERRACVARELSKLHEEITTTTLEALKLHYTQKDVKGEIVLVVAGKPD
jgi:16S rRNA (cytidine1402-2'-O)-methyltransferase